jgi:hypothetical protein
VYAGHVLGLGFWPFFGARVAILLLVVGVTPTGNRDAGLATMAIAKVII